MVIVKYIAHERLNSEVGLVIKALQIESLETDGGRWAVKAYVL